MSSQRTNLFRQLKLTLANFIRWTSHTGYNREVITLTLNRITQSKISIHGIRWYTTPTKLNTFLSIRMKIKLKCHMQANDSCMMHINVFSINSQKDRSVMKRHRTSIQVACKNYCPIMTTSAFTSNRKPVDSCINKAPLRATFTAH